MSDFASIVVSSRNRPELLFPSLKNLWANTFYPYELVVHDDGSSAEMQDKLRHYLSAGKISTLIMQPTDHNLGHGSATNRAIDVSRGDPIIKLNGDECFSSGWLEKTVRALKLFPEIGILHLSYYWKQANHSSWTTNGVIWDLEPNTLATFQREGVVIRVVWVGPGTDFAFTRKTWKETGPWIQYKCPSFGEDWNWRVAVCPMMRLLPVSHSTRYPPLQQEEYIDHWQHFKETPWLAVLDPPVVSYHPGHAKGSIVASRATLKDGPLLLGGAHADP